MMQAEHNSEQLSYYDEMRDWEWFHSQTQLNPASCHHSSKNTKREKPLYQIHCEPIKNVDRKDSAMKLAKNLDGENIKQAC